MTFSILENCHLSYDALKIKECSPGDSCSFSWDSNGLIQDCQSGFPGKISISTRINTKTFDDIQTIQFLCGYEQCNSNETFIELKSLVDQYFDLSSMRQALFKNRPIQIEQNTTHSQHSTDISTESLMTINIHSTDQINSTKSSTQTTQKTNSSSAASLFSFNIAFWFLCISRFILE